MEGLSVSQSAGFMEKEGNGGGEEIIDLRSSQARSGERFGILRKALNLEW